MTVHLELSRSAALNAVLIGSAVHFVTIPLWGALSDRLGRRPVTQIGAIGMALWAFGFFALLDTRSFPVIVLAVTVGLLLHGAMYGPQAAFISEMFDTKVRYSGASMGSQLASIIGGALAPIIAVELLKDYGSSVPISLYLCFASLVTVVTVWIAKETREPRPGQGRPGRFGPGRAGHRHPQGLGPARPLIPRPPRTASAARTASVERGGPFHPPHPFRPQAPGRRPPYAHRRDSPGPRHSATALRGLLDLLAQGAAAEEFERPAATAREAGAPAAELAEITEATAVALRIRRTLGQHRVREAQLTALFDTASDLAALRDLDAVLRAIVHRAKLLLGTDVTYLSLNDDAAGDTYMRVTDGSVAEAFQRVRLGMGEGLGGLVAQTARPYATGDYAADTRFHHTTTIDSAVLDEGLRAILGVPLRLGSRIIGVLYAADRAPREFTAGEVALLSSLADHAAIAIDGARLLEETRAALVDLNAASETIRTHSEAMRRAEEAHDQLTDLVLRGGGADDVAAALADILDGGILIHDADGAELARARTGPQPPPTPAVAASRARGRAVPLNGTWVCAVLAGPELLGSIALTGRADLADADRLLFERASVVTALLMLLRRSVAETEDRVRGELLGDLLSRTGDPGTLTARARRLGVDLGRRHSVFVAQGEAAPRHRLLAAAARSAQTREGLAGLHHDHVVLVAPPTPRAPTPERSPPNWARRRAARSPSARRAPPPARPNSPAPTTRRPAASPPCVPSATPGAAGP